jgi:hypothetical protein
MRPSQSGLAFGDDQDVIEYAVQKVVALADNFFNTPRVPSKCCRW